MTIKTHALTSRAFRGDDDFQAVIDFVRLERPYDGLPDYWQWGQGAIAVYVTMYGGFDPFSPNDYNDHRLWCDAEGKVRAYSYIFSAQQVYRIQAQHGYRTEAQLKIIMKDAETRLKTVHPDKPIKTPCFNSDRWLENLLTAQGYRKGDAFDVYMRQSLDRDIPGVPIPAGYVLRPFKGEVEFEERAGAQWNAFGGSYEAGEWMLDGMRRFMAYSEVFTEDLELVMATDDDTTIAAVTHIMINPYTKIGEFEPVATRPDHHRKGLGRAMLTYGLQQMQAKGMKTALVRTGVDNLPAIGLYEAVGYEVVDHLHWWHK